MPALDHDAEVFDPSQLPQDFGVFFLNRKESAGPPRKITPYMLACIYYLASELDLPVKEKGVVAGLLRRIKFLLPWAGFFMLIFGATLMLSHDHVPLRWLGWLLSIGGALLLGGFFIVMLLTGRYKKKGYLHVLQNGSLVSAHVRKHLIADGLVRVLKFHKPVLKDGVPGYEREWIRQSVITIHIEKHEIEFTTFRPEIIGVFVKGAEVPVLWHPKRPNIFIPVEK